MGLDGNIFYYRKVGAVMKAKIHRVFDRPLVPYYSKAMASLDAKLCCERNEHWAETEINSIEELMQIVNETGVNVIVGWNFNKTIVDIVIYDDWWE